MEPAKRKLPTKRIAFTAGTYASRVDGAVYVHIGDDYIYFHETHVIAIHSGNTLYRNYLGADGHHSNMMVRRLRQIIQQSGRGATKDVSRNELRNMAEAILMRAAAKLVDHRLGIQTEQ